MQFTDSLPFAPRTPYQRAGVTYNRYKGIDTGVLKGRTITEAREWVIEKIAKEMDKEITLGKQLPEDELLKRTVAGFQPWKKMAEIKSRKKDVGVKDLELFTWWL